MPRPVKAEYVMNIQPDGSVIKSFLDAGLGVYIIDWGYPTVGDRYMTMDDHVRWYMSECADFIRNKASHKKSKPPGICRGSTFWRSAWRCIRTGSTLW